MTDKGWLEEMDRLAKETGSITVHCRLSQLFAQHARELIDAAQRLKRIDNEEASAGHKCAMMEIDLTNQIDNLRSLLRRMEWVVPGATVARTCYMCSTIDYKGHTSDCELAKALEEISKP